MSKWTILVFLVAAAAAGPVFDLSFMLEKGAPRKVQEKEKEVVLPHIIAAPPPTTTITAPEKKWMSEDERRGGSQAAPAPGVYVSRVSSQNFIISLTTASNR